MQLVSQEQVPLDAGCPRCLSRFVLWEEFAEYGCVRFTCHECGCIQLLRGIEAIVLWSLLQERVDHPERFAPLDPLRN